MQSALFGFVEGIEIVPTTPSAVDTIHRIYVELARRGKGSSEQRLELSNLAEALIKKERLDAIVLAGTDFVSLFDESNTSFPAIDCAALHISAIFDRLLPAKS